MSGSHTIERFDLQEDIFSIKYSNYTPTIMLLQQDADSNYFKCESEILLRFAVIFPSVSSF